MLGRNLKSEDKTLEEALQEVYDWSITKKYRNTRVKKQRLKVRQECKEILVYSRSERDENGKRS